MSNGKYLFDGLYDFYKINLSSNVEYKAHQIPKLNVSHLVL